MRATEQQAADTYDWHAQVLRAGYLAKVAPLLEAAAGDLESPAGRKLHGCKREMNGAAASLAHASSACAMLGLASDIMICTVLCSTVCVPGHPQPQSPLRSV